MKSRQDSRCAAARITAGTQSRSWGPVVAALVLAASLVGTTAQVRHEPRSERESSNQVSAGDLAARATIRRDRYGVPHILAETEEAAAYAHGYVAAEDHGALLARAFLRARGALASVFGPDFVDEDIRTRTLGIHETAVERFKDLPPFMRAIVDGYAAGYNAYLTQRPAEFPAWASRVTGIDVLAHARAVLLLDFALDLEPWRQQPATAASNMWAIGRSLSESGGGMLLANPHLSWDVMPLFHEVHLTVPDVINVSGASFVGVPVVTIGFNQKLGWSHTVNRVDADDVYELTLDESRQRYLYDGRWLPLESRLQSIDVRTQQGKETRRHTALYSHYGPVMQVKGDKALAFKSANLDAVNFVTQYNAMAKATTLQEFRAAVNMQQLPMFNLSYADAAGNIWYLFNGRIPVRPRGYTWSGVVPGNTFRSEWLAVHPVSALPQLFNPPSGYVQNCNDAPWYSNLQHPIDRAPFAEYLRAEGVTARGQLSLKILSAEKQVTLEELMAYKFNSEIALAHQLKDELLGVVRARGSTWAAAADVLQAWDNSSDGGSRGAILFNAWWDEYREAVPREFRIPWSRNDPTGTPKGLADPDAAVAAFGRAVDSVTKTYGRVDVAWGEVHRLRRGDLDLPATGAPSTLLNMEYEVARDGKRVAVAGDTYVLVVEFSDTPRAFSILPYSQSSNPRSPYYNNQMPLYARKQFKPAWFLDRDIAEHLDREYRAGR